MGRSGANPQPDPRGPGSALSTLGVLVTLLLLAGATSGWYLEEGGSRMRGDTPPEVSPATPASDASEGQIPDSGGPGPNELAGNSMPPVPSLSAKSSEGALSRSGEALWGFYVYMAADNSLWEEAQWDLNEMKSVGSRPGLLEIVTLTDYQERSGYKDEADIRNGTTRAYHVVKGGLEQTPLNRLNTTWKSEVDMGRGESLSDFLSWAIDAYPAQNRVLVIWDHGKGWKKVAEDTGGSYLTMPEIAGALERVGVTFTMIGFDACLMAQAEIVHTLAPHTELVIGSQAYEPALGWSYDAMLGSLLPDLPELETSEVASRLVHHYVEPYRNGSKSSDYSVTYSAVAVEDLPRLEAALDELAWILRNISRVYRTTIWEVRDSTQTFHDNDFLDLYHFSQLIAQRVPIPQVKASAQRVQTALEAAVVADDNWYMPNRRDVTNAHGLSIYFPDNAIRGDYFDLSFTHGSAWPGFLDDIFHPKGTTGDLEAIRVEPQDLDDNGYPEVLEWQANYTLDTSGGNLLVQVLDGHMGLVSTETLILERDRDNLTGAPLEVVRSGDYHVRFLLYDEQGYLAHVVNQGPFTLDLRLPDLTVSNLALRYQDHEVSGLLEGDRVNVSVQVSNQGTVASLAFRLDLTVDELELSSLDLEPLGPGDSVIRSIPWTPPFNGSFSIEARVEADDPEEADPRNNVLVRTVQVHPASPSPFSPSITLSLIQAPALLQDGSGLSPALLEVTLANPAGAPFDLVDLEAVIPPEWDLSPPGAPTLVGSGTTVGFNLSLQIPLRTVAGDYQAQLTAIARDGTAGATGTLTVTVPGYTGAGLSAILDRPRLETGGQGQVLITIANHGNQPATFILQKELPPHIIGWLQDALVELDPFQNTTTQLNLEVQRNLAPGEYRLHLVLKDPVDQREIVSLNLTLPVVRGNPDDDGGLLSAPSLVLAALVVAGATGFGRRIPGKKTR